MMRLEDLQLFVRTALLGSFSEAAREADMLPGQVSAAIVRIERGLGVRLFARSTRSLRLTGEGERYLPFAQEALARLAEGREQLDGAPDEPGGPLLVAAPSDLGRNVLLPWLAEFRRRHPRVALRLALGDRVSDVFREPVDAAIRYAPVQDASFVALPLAPANRRVLVAAPQYLQARGRPERLDDLARHDTLVYLLSSRVHDRWTFDDPASGQRRTVRVRGAIHCDDGDAVRRLALAGEGIAYKSWLDVARDVRAKRLEVLLPQYAGEPAPLHLVCPHRQQYRSAVRLLHAALRERLAAADTGA
ncbi:LysR substrate-binding domain-containing protein [Pseudorhodoferax sp.]|uniref:LysR family transcriptional regulator n=1 Tax=Pseudorhodoferax sp. TaxID=1993553 RepID=UPI0039E4B89E